MTNKVVINYRRSGGDLLSWWILASLQVRGSVHKVTMASLRDSSEPRTQVSALGVDLSLIPYVGLLRHVSQRVSLKVIPGCLSGCLSVIPRPTAYHD